MSVNSLDTLTFPLHGQRLIEASAGTGKTFTIAGLYLRLLLGHGADGAAHHTPLAVDNILVVTFTEAATQELRDRIRARIHDARLAFSRGHSNDPVIAPLLNEICDHQSAERLLLAAERQMDSSAVYTIHGFCQRMLTQNAFESGSLFSNEFITDEMPLREHAVADFWRQRFYALPSSLVDVMMGYWDSPYKLLKEINSYLSGALPEIIAPPLPADLIKQHDTNLSVIEKIKQQWCQAEADIHGLITKSGVDKRSYSNRYLPVWIEEVSQWAKSKTHNYSLAKQLDKFSAARLHEKTKKGEPPSHAVFDAIDELLETPLEFKKALTAFAIKEVRVLLEKEKKRFGRLSFDDLLSQLGKALEKDQEGVLAERIRTLYPVAMIDEFQDTDPVQYQVFNSIYAGQSTTGLFMIGDPKQAIYAFRGADIFTYIHARRSVTHHYNLGTNWRSTADMVLSVNRIFEHGVAPFIYDADIPFEPVKFAPKADAKTWEINGVKQAAMTFWLDGLGKDKPSAEAENSKLNLEKEDTPFLDQSASSLGYSSKTDYLETMAQSTAASIRHVLEMSEKGRACFRKGEDKHSILAKNIAVLVRKGAEANLIKKALAKQGIASVYMSNRDSVFSSQIVKDVHYFLMAVLTPDNERALKAALATSLLALSANELDSLNHDEHLWEKAVAEFSHYQKVWFSRGVLPMLRQFIQRRAIAERLLTEEKGERSLTDLLHLGELLQEVSQTLESHSALVRWLLESINEPNSQSDEQKIRLESERDLVQIVTIHKSKGLEYDLVYLPFVCDYRAAQQAFFHDENTHKAILDLENEQDGIQKAEKERLAEDLRLIYVALTRAVYGCFIGLAPLKKSQGKQEIPVVHLSAMGYLIQQGEEKDPNGLLESIKALIAGNAQMELVQPPSMQYGQMAALAENANKLHANIFKGRIDRNWRLTSYSGLLRQGHLGGNSLDLLDDELNIDAKTLNSQTNADNQLAPYSSLFQFPRGARPGTFLHTLFERVSFSESMQSKEVVDTISHLLTVENYEQEWLSVLQKTLEQLVSTPLNQEGLVLSELNEAKCLVEMEFMMPIDRLQCARVNQVIKAHDPLSAMADTLNFETASGMLKGFIDLVFCWNDKYYILDWKSNYLGDTSLDYNQNALAGAMVEHRYDFQYQIYALALHRYLSHRLADYDYSRHFGGVYYLFIRGIEAGTDNGIFYTLPSADFIKELDALFAHEASTSNVFSNGTL